MLPILIPFKFKPASELVLFSSALAGMLFSGDVSHFFWCGFCVVFVLFLVTSLRRKSVRLMITAVLVNISKCLNRVYVTVPDRFPVRILERA